MKKAILLILFLPLLVFALEECPRFGTISNIPCIQPSTWNPGTCSDYNLSVYNSTDGLILETSWFDYLPFCAFNLTGIEDTGTYCYNSTIESGCITLEREDNMLSIILVQLGLIVFFIFLGIPHKFGVIKFTSWALAVLELVITVWMVYINHTGNDITQLLYINAYTVLVLGGILGFITIFMIMVRLMTKEKPVKDDAYTKFVYEQK